MTRDRRSRRGLLTTVLLAATVTVWTGLVLANSPINRPYRNTFEGYTNNQSPVGYNGWYANTNLYAVATNMTYAPPACGYVFPDSNHYVVVKLDTENSAVTNAFAAPASDTNVVIDTMIMFVQSPDEDAQGIITNDNKINLAYYVNTNGCVVVYHSIRWYSLPFYYCSNAFSTISSPTIASGEWARITVQMDYKSDTYSLGPDKYFRLSINGTLTTNRYAFESINDRATTGTWFVCANKSAAPQKYLSSVNFSGTGYFDDYSVIGDSPPPWAITFAINDSRGGWIWPGGIGAGASPVFVLRNDSTNFTMGTNAYWSYTNLFVDGVPQTPTNYLEFLTVTTNHDFSVFVSAQRSTNYNIPKWWIAQQNTSWTNADEMESILMGDQDNDGMATWKEYFAGTHPYNPDSVLEIIEFSTTDGTNFTLKWPTTYSDSDLLPIPFYVERAGNLTNPTWSVAATVPRQSVGVYTYEWMDTNAPPAEGSVFYRVAAATNAP